MLYEKQELVEKLTSLDYKYTMAIWTDKADFVECVDDLDRLLEVRSFDERGEFKAYRSTIDSKFKIRVITSDSEYGNGYIDETHYLDIDTTKCEKQNPLKVTTGGGKYHLPEAVVDCELLKVRYFYKYDDDGVARKFDWRIVGFEKEGKR